MTRRYDFQVFLTYLTFSILALNTGQLKKKATLPHVYNEVNSEPTITRYASIVRKTLRVTNVLQTLNGGTPCHTAYVNSIVHFCTDSLQHVRVYGCHSGDDAPDLTPCDFFLWAYVKDVFVYVRTTPAKWSSRIETAHHRRCGNHKQGHAGESLDRNGLSDW
jgi:hypothetical protein